MDSFSNGSNPQTSLADVNDRSNNNTPLVLNNSDNGKVQYNGIPTELETYYCFYKMNHKKQGIAYIFNHENFQNPKQCSKRKGTDEDARKLSTTLKNLKIRYLKKEDIKHHIEQDFKKQLTFYLE
ncbi:hypothetical protein NQ317_016976 [Molorchus minor]|uniref:Caspase family p20 domain-containing protein n=1 Tax=Molorchus minor TaxID=1323400 RepID=A0ABQ9IVB1_9CUCU|nr:hypothetical protein NQ317_016976 [Molorchus minor]